MKLNVMGSKKVSVSFMPSGKQNYIIYTHSVPTIWRGGGGDLDNPQLGIYLLSWACRVSSEVMILLLLL
jgi:hypothetical protein